MNKYNHNKIEAKWQAKWEKEKLYEAKDFEGDKFYCLIEFPYPSGEGLHVGHPRSYTAMDILARKKRMEGKNVLFPIGFDAFGLPAENYAIKTGTHPKATTKKNITNFTRQLKALGFTFDWSRAIDTTDPGYYKWTQWIFLKLYEKGLAYKAKIDINWCIKCNVGLANEEVVNGACERCGGEVVRKEREQWMLKITEYAGRLEKDLDAVDYPPKIKKQQIDWIGRSEGVEVEFRIKNSEFRIEAFTTRPDTLYGATYMVLAPEHELIKKLEDRIQNLEEVKKYIESAKKKSDMERTELAKKKTGVELKGLKVINPVNNEEIPIWIADYVLTGYGTGAIMAVPAHDERDWEFARKYKLPIKEVVAPYYKFETKKDKKIEKRDIVAAIVKDKKRNAFLCLEWNDLNWKSFPAGGIKKGEGLVGAARREVEEETGYKNTDFIKEVGAPFYESFYRPHKDSNVVGKFHYLYFELKNGEKIEVKQRELKQHKAVWINESEIENYVNVNSPQVAIKRLLHGDQVYVGEGISINSGIIDDMETAEAKERITVWLEKKGLGKKAVKYKLRDWVFSRQRYWGEPIPIVICDICGYVPVDEDDLPVELPEVENYRTTDNGDSPLTLMEDWVNVKCPKCGGSAKRETDTMPQWAGSSWYFLRYIDPHNDKKLADPVKLKYWTPVDWYNGGMEHTTLHLLYSRFWHKFLYDIEVVPTPEPYAKRTSHGMILGEDGEKMSKSRGNVINPDDIILEFGADTFRAYEMFMGPFDQATPWSTQGVVGVRRFLEKFWGYIQAWKKGKIKETAPATKILLNKTIKQVSSQIDTLDLNTCVSSFMVFVNQIKADAEYIAKEDLQNFIKLMSPFVPHFAEECWEALGGAGSIFKEKWPECNEDFIQEEEREIVVQINGKVRARITVSSSKGGEEVLSLAKKQEPIRKRLEGRKIKREVYIAGRLVNFVI